VRLTAWEEDRLLIFSAAELARRRLARGVALSQPEVVALICDAMLEAARDGASYAEVERAGRAAVRPDQVIPGVAQLVDEVRLEVLMGDGTRLVVIRDPLRAGGDEPVDEPVDGPGAVRPGTSARAAATGWAPPERERRELDVRSTSQRVIRVSSHFPFHRVNRRLEFDREAARGFRLDLRAGDTLRWSPGEAKRVRLVRYAADPGGIP
jgi:urease subunit gamma/beta